uniref:Uncharacterized protein n=1 Tax=Megaselia scalaris TaxID=36166 RepID=T1GQ13_MEGSC
MTSLSSFGEKIALDFFLPHPVTTAVVPVFGVDVANSMELYSGWFLYATTSITCPPSLCKVDPTRTVNSWTLKNP